ncbi:LysM peptidoglycan-binding domain-containing protein [Mesobacillus subterraneus]|uniref:LysM peptidoglycan-binding domain-containing protein n=1 Tax=Mesobacillus subterraneus TaxID=285983 RepID=UPI001B870309|nr:LysM peptidoglycan-binding domain-containing protein [Mesobacillus subterraneus]
MSDLIINNPQIENPDIIFVGQATQIPPKLCPTLRLGDRGPDVSRIQILLQFLGVYSGRIDGIFGPLTHSAVKEWQSTVKEIEISSGIVDTNTWYSLGFECEPRPAITQYMVRPGSSLYIIAAWFGVTVESIMRINPQITDPNLIFPGQVINIPASL